MYVAVFVREGASIAFPHGVYNRKSYATTPDERADVRRKDLYIWPKSSHFTAFRIGLSAVNKNLGDNMFLHNFCMGAFWV